jgi:hypothetical protein
MMSADHQLGFCINCQAMPLVGSLIHFEDYTVRCTNLKICPECRTVHVMDNNHECPTYCRNKINCLALPSAVRNEELSKAWQYVN